MENQLNFCSQLWNFLIYRVDWAAWITLSAVLVALYPIIRDYRRAKAQARNLRIRLVTSLLKTMPSLKSVILPEGHPAITTEAILSREDFQNTVREIGVLLEQGSILEADELDHLGVTHTHLDLSSQIYKTAKLDSEMATNILHLVDRAIKLMSSHGFHTTNIEKPWEKKTG